MSDYFEMSYGSNKRPRPYFPQQRRIANNSIHLSKEAISERGKIRTAEYRIIGIDNDNVWEQIQQLIAGKNVKTTNETTKDALGEVLNPLTFISKRIFKYKSSVINADKIIMAGESEYSSDIIGFCKPMQRGYYYHYGSEQYDYFNTGIQDPRRMWAVIKEVLVDPKYCIVYEV